MNWFEVLKEQRQVAQTAQSFKPIQLDKPINIKKPEKDCYQKLIDYVQSCGLNIREEFPNYVQFTDKKNMVILPSSKSITSKRKELYCLLLEDLKQHKFLETKDAEQAILPDKTSGHFGRFSYQVSNSVNVHYINRGVLLDIIIYYN